MLQKAGRALWDFAKATVYVHYIETSKSLKTHWGKILRKEVKFRYFETV